jgi:ABC-type phosphate transport system substrate-binding protein
MRLATPLAIAAVAATLLASCGGSSDDGTGTGATSAPRAADSSAPAGATAKSCATHGAKTKGLRATGLGCEQARLLIDEWGESEDCAAPAGSSRSACSLGSYRCLAAATDRGLTVSCARSGQSVAFTVRRG